MYLVEKIKFKAKLLFPKLVLLVWEVLVVVFLFGFGLLIETETANMKSQYK